MVKNRPFDQWTPNLLLEALREGSQDEKLVLVKAAGILSEDGKLAPMYQTWGAKASRTPEEPETEEGLATTGT